MAGIGAEIWANRIKLGPMARSVESKFEEFFLSSWVVGDPAMIVDVPANAVAHPAPQEALAAGAAHAPPGSGRPACRGGRSRNQAASFAPSPARLPVRAQGSRARPRTGRRRGPASLVAATTATATKAFFPDDPSNVYHSYLNDHVRFRIIHAGGNITHVHHLHAHQWLRTPESDESLLLDSQTITPGDGFTQDIIYGSGNRNLTVGDSIFHCHFYPHFAQGMWSLWRSHDVFEGGTKLDPQGVPTSAARALPDGEIAAGTPIPAVVPIPTLPMAPMPAATKIVKLDDPKNPGQLSGYNAVLVDQYDKKNPGYPFFIPGVGGRRSPASAHGLRGGRPARHSTAACPGT